MSKNLRYWVYGLVLAWVVLVFLSFERFQATDPTGSGFTRGWYLTSLWLKFQFAGLGAGGTAGFLAYRHRENLSRRDRWIGWTPALLSGTLFALLVGFFVAMVIWGWIQRA